MPFVTDYQDYLRIQKFPSCVKCFGKINAHEFPLDTVEKESNLPVRVTVYLLDYEETIEDVVKECEFEERCSVEHPSFRGFLKTIADEKDRVVYTLCEPFDYDSIAAYAPEDENESMVIMKHLLELTSFLAKRQLMLPHPTRVCIERNAENKIENILYPRRLTRPNESCYYYQGQNIDQVFSNLADFAYQLFFGEYLGTNFESTSFNFNCCPRPDSKLFKLDDEKTTFVKTLLAEKSFNFESVMQTQLMKKAGIQLDLSENFTKTTKACQQPGSNCLKKENPKAENPDSMAKFLSLCRQDPEQLMTFECKGGEKVEAITNLMSTLSPVIKNAINTKNDFYNPATNTFQIFGFDPKNIQKMVEFCESSSIQETAGSEMELLEIASFFKIEILEEYAAKLCIEAVTNVNIIEMFQLARKLKNLTLEKVCIEYGIKNAAAYMTADITNVSPECVHQFLSQLRSCQTKPQ